MTKYVRSVPFWVVVALVVLVVASQSLKSGDDRRKLRYGELVERVEAGDVAKAEVKDEIRKMRDLTDKPFAVNIAQAFGATRASSTSWSTRASRW